MSNLSNEKIDEKEDLKYSKDGAASELGAAPTYVEGVEGERLHRGLKNRHIQMISIGGVIGTGLFLGTASALQNGGPLGLLLGYTIIGSICFAVMVSLGEMTAYLPIAGGHIALAERFVNPAMSFAMGWNYWYNWVIVLPAELSAAAVLINYWNTSVNNSVWIIMTLVVVVIINMLGANAYGEAEFIFASIKVLTITGLIILGLIIDLGGGPDHHRIGFAYWQNPGPFAQYAGIPGPAGRFAGFWAVMSQAAFSYIGTEIVAIAAGEAKNPRRNIPKAIKRVYIRILLFYILGTLIIGMLVPWDDPALSLNGGTAGRSPFVIAIQRSGIQALPSIINACLLTSAWSAASSDLYTSSRALYGLAIAGNAPRIFAKTLRYNGLPWVSVILCSLFAFLAFMGINAGSGKVFGWFANMTAIAGLATWFGIAITYTRFYAGMKAQGIDRTKLPFYSRLQPFLAWYVIVSTFIVGLFSGFDVFIDGHWDNATFFTNYVPFVLFPILYFSWRYISRVPMIKPHEMDFVTGIAEIEAATYDEPPPRNALERFWQWIM